MAPCCGSVMMCDEWCFQYITQRLVSAILLLVVALAMGLGGCVWLCVVA